MSDEEEYQGDKGAEEGSRQDLAIFDSLHIRFGTQRNAAQGPWQSGHQVGYHEDVVPIVIIRRCDICPAPARQGPEYPHSEYKLWEGRSRSLRKNVPEEYKRKPRAGRHGDEQLEDCSFRVSVTDCSGNRGKPFVGIALGP